MDLYCPLCAEPIDMDYIHDVVDDRRSTGDTVATFDTVYRSFIRRGCPAVDMTCNDTTDTETTETIRMIYDILGSDPDGAASMMDDMMTGHI